MEQNSTRRSRLDMLTSLCSRLAPRVDLQVRLAERVDYIKSRCPVADLAHHAETDQAIRIVGHGPEAIGGTTRSALVEPAAAANDPIKVVIVGGQDALCRSG